MPRDVGGSRVKELRPFGKDMAGTGARAAAAAAPQGLRALLWLSLFFKSVAGQTYSGGGPGAGLFDDVKTADLLGASLEVDSAAALVAALKNASVGKITLTSNLEIGGADFWGGPISVNRSVIIEGGAGAGQVTVTSILEGEWLRMESGYLALWNLHFGPGVFELFHKDGRMPLTMAGVYLYGDFVPGSGSPQYCGCTGFWMINCLVDIDSTLTPYEAFELMRSQDQPIAETIQLNSVFTRSRWSFLDLEASVFPADMSFRMHNTTMAFTAVAESNEYLGESQPDCQTVASWDIRGQDYTGPENSVVVDGSTWPCLDWASVELVGMNFSSIESNSCRNTADHPAAWCFYGKLDLIPKTLPYSSQELLDNMVDFMEYGWAFCDVPSCTQVDGLTSPTCQAPEDKGALYTGSVNTTFDGAPCMDWDDRFPALHGFLQGNSCRNPSGVEDYAGCINSASHFTRCNVEYCVMTTAEMPPAPGPESPEEPSDSWLVIAAVVGAIVVVVAMAGCVMAAWCLRNKKDKRHVGFNNIVTMEGGKSMPAAEFKSERAWSKKGSDSYLTETSSIPKSVDTEKLRQQNIMDDSVVLSTPTDMGLLECRKKLGSGSFATVWQARWLGADVAVKVMVLKGRPLALRLHILKGVEANCLRGITHPNIVQTYHIYKVQDRNLPEDQLPEDLRDPAEEEGPSISEIWMVQELCNKGDLKQNCKLISPSLDGDAEVLLITLKEIMLALSYLHHQGIVHGDLKRENILLKSSSTPHGFTTKVADFGLARDLQGLDSYYATNISGDMKYLAPEVLEHRKVSYKMDTYSFAFIVFELCVGAATDTTNITLATHVQQVVHERKRPKFPLGLAVPELADLAVECWQQDPDQRPCDQYVLHVLDTLMEQYGADMNALEVCQDSFKNLPSATIAEMMKGGAVEQDGYIMPEMEIPLKVTDSVGSAPSPLIQAGEDTSAGELSETRDFSAAVKLVQ